MDDVKALHRRLLKFTRGDVTDETEALDVLRALESTTVTYAILKETKLGHTVGKLRKHDNDKLAAVARGLVKAWKSMALSPKPAGAVGAERKLSGSSVSSMDDKIPRKAVVPRSNGASSSPVKKPTPKPAPRASLGPLIPAGLDKVRATVRTKLKETLAASEGGSPDEVAVAIEIAMARMFQMGMPKENKKEYTAKFRQLSFNLKKNAVLREDLLQDAVSAEQLINMSADELATEEKRNEIQKLRDDAFQRARLDWADANAEKINKQCGIENAKGLFTCGRCKSSKTSNTQKQTRSADEPMTVFVHCHNCGNRWKC
jgi:transcription elongation factor S-II